VPREREQPREIPLMGVNVRMSGWTGTERFVGQAECLREREVIEIRCMNKHRKTFIAVSDVGHSVRRYEHRTVDADVERDNQPDVRSVTRRQDASQTNQG